MAIPFSTARIVDHWIEYPLSQFGDNTSKIYYMRVVVDTDSYTTLETGVGNLTDAASAGVYSLPASFVDSTARFCEDRTPTSLTGGVTEFVRVFANVPPDYEDYSTGIKTTAPVYGEKIEPTRYGLDAQANTIYLKTRKIGYVINPVDSFPVRMRLEVSFTVGAPGAQIEEEGFELTRSDGVVTDEVYGGDPVTQTTQGVVTVTPTGTANVIQGTQSTRWMGDIYKNVTGYSN